MNSNWRSFLESSGAAFKDGSDEVLNFGDASAELQAARDHTVLVPLTHLGLIEVTGDDAKAFLHSQFTSDINHLGADQEVVDAGGIGDAHCGAAGAGDDGAQERVAGGWLRSVGVDLGDEAEPGLVGERAPGALHDLAPNPGVAFRTARRSAGGVVISERSLCE